MIPFLQWSKQTRVEIIFDMKMIIFNEITVPNH
jgi:hypothetical protein